MRVLHVTDRLPSPARGGLDLHVAELTRELIARGVDARVLEALPAEVAQEEQGGLRRALTNRPIIESFKQALAEHEPDVVHFHNLQQLSHRLPEVARARGAQVVWTLHDFFALCQRVHLHTGDGSPCEGPRAGVACGTCFAGKRGLIAAPVFLLRQAGFESALRVCHALVAPSEFARDVYLRHDVPPERLHVIPPAVPAPDRMADLPADPAVVRFVFAGDIRRAKGADLALEALLELEEEYVRLDVYGGRPAPPAEPELELENLLLAIRDERTAFHGRYAPDDLLEILDGAAALIVPSRVRETFGRTANLALQAGIPVIAPRSGALPEFVEDGVNGALFEPDDAGSLAAAMRRIITEGILMQSQPEGWPRAPTLAGHVDALLPLYEWSP